MLLSLFSLFSFFSPSVAKWLVTFHSGFPFGDRVMVDNGKNKFSFSFPPFLLMSRMSPERNIISTPKHPEGAPFCYRRVY